MESKDLRVSDAEREHVGTLLQRAVRRGMLSLGEFTERMDTGLAAKTRAELNAVLVDLPGLQIRPEYRAQPAAPVSAPLGPAAPVPGPGFPGHAPGAPTPTIRGRLSTIDRRGGWDVPPVLRLDTLMSSVTLDFTEAVTRTQVVRIRVDDYLSAITLIVPAEATADINGLGTVAASAQSKVRTGPPFGPLHLIVDGTVRLGSVDVKHPLGTTLRKLLG